MSTIKAIRERLGLTQEELGKGIGCTQGNVGHYERGQQILPPDRAGVLIDFASSRGLALTMDQIYGRAMLPAPKVAANDPTPQGAARA